MLHRLQVFTFHDTSPLDTCILSAIALHNLKVQVAFPTYQPVMTPGPDLGEFIRIDTDGNTVPAGYSVHAPNWKVSQPGSSSRPQPVLEMQTCCRDASATLSLSVSEEPTKSKASPDTSGEGSQAGLAEAHRAGRGQVHAHQGQAARAQPAHRVRGGALPQHRVGAPECCCPCPAQGRASLHPLAPRGLHSCICCEHTLRTAPCTCRSFQV